MRNWILEGFFLLLLTALTIGFFRVTAPFLMDIFFAMILVSMSWPLMEFFSKRLRSRRGLAALAALATDVLIVAVPLGGLATLFSIKTAGGIQAVIASWPERFSTLTVADVFSWLESLPVLGSMAKLFEANITELVGQTFNFGSRIVAELASRSLAGFSAFIFHLFILLLLMYFLFKDGQVLHRRVRELLPLADTEADQLLLELKNTTTATLVSTLIIGLIEGALGGLLFLIFGLPSPLFFALLMVVVSIIPLVGTNLILVPAGIILIFNGRIFAGIVIIVVGLVGVAVTQNVIKPKLLGGRSGLHPALALLGILGGIAWLGVVGFVVGPLLVSLFVVIWDQFGKRYRALLQNRNDAGPKR